MGLIWKALTPSPPSDMCRLAWGISDTLSPSEEHQGTNMGGSVTSSIRVIEGVNVGDLTPP